MGRITNRGISIDVPVNFAGAGIDANPTPGFVRDDSDRIGNRFIARKNKKIKYVAAAETAIVPLYSFDFANALAAKNGLPAPFEATLEEAFPDFVTADIVDGVGWQYVKVAGQPYGGHFANFNPAIMATLRTVGIAAVIDAYFEPDPVLGQVNTTWFYGKAQISFGNYNTRPQSTTSSSIQMRHGVDSINLEAYQYDYDYDFDTYAWNLISNDTVTGPKIDDTLGFIGALLSIKPDQCRTAWDGNEVKTSTGPSVTTNTNPPEYGSIGIWGAANWTGSHNRFEVTGKSTMTRLDLYQSVPDDWTPPAREPLPHTPIATYDFVNERYALNGAPVAFADVAAELYTPLPTPTNGVGLVSQCPLGVASPTYRNSPISFKLHPDVVAQIVANGATVVADIEIENPVATGGAYAYSRYFFEAVNTITYDDDVFGGPEVDTRTSPIGATASYLYHDAVNYGKTTSPDASPVGTRRIIHHVNPDQFRIEEDGKATLDLDTTGKSVWGKAGVDAYLVDLYSIVHLGTQADREASSCGVTLKRLTIYPMQADDWRPL